MPEYEFFATTAKGLEPLLAAELSALEAEDIIEETGGVRFSGSIEACYRANLWLRTANRILMPIAGFPCTDVESLYREVRALPWDRYLTPDMTLAVDCNLRDSSLTHAGFAALKTKDAVVDHLRDRFGRRPNVDTRDPDLRINVHLVRNHCTISLDTSGGSLHLRGYRREKTEAPLRETLAAGLVDLSGWDGSTPFIDPMCGSGTLIIEAALKATRRAPGLLRPNYAFQRWPGYRPELWQALVREARDGVRQSLEAPIFGSDLSSRALAITRSNACRAGIDRFLTLARRDLRDLAPPPGPGILLFNPPYGERLGDSGSLETLYREIGDVLKQRCTGYTAYLFTGNPRLAKFVGLKASRRIVLFNGPIECRLLKYDLY
jgi:putative N6-adenine-specific DNA methylase